MDDKKKVGAAAVGAGTAFAIACVAFSTHAGAGFATGNQATQYYVSNTRVMGIFAVILAMGLLSLVLREAIIMRNTRDLKNHREIFETLYAPYSKLFIVFEIYINLMIIFAVGSVVAGTAGLFKQVFDFSESTTRIVLGIALIFLTIFGAKLVTRVATILTIGILGSLAIVFFMGILKAPDLPQALSFANVPGANVWAAIRSGFVYAGFQCIVIPAITAVGKPLVTRKSVSLSMFFTFLMNAGGLGVSVVMLLGWFSKFTLEKQVLPTVFITQQLGLPVLYVFYSIALFCCLLSTGVSLVYGCVTRFENSPLMLKIENPIPRRILIAIISIAVSVIISTMGLTNIVKYGYGSMGYVGIVFIVIPFLTIGRKKNKEWIATHGE
ncbi:MAG: hypothetical protein LBQ96_00590 [Fusobacteriaceae bacterium]|jgi:uncharacterized membrane protein YkvI|nr:hypothetical protein [Fusobacteriaceae bacterium]